MLRMLLTVTVIAAPCLLLIDPPRRFFTWVMYAFLLLMYATAITLAVTWLTDRKTLQSLFGRLGGLMERFSR